MRLLAIFAAVFLTQSAFSQDIPPATVIPSPDTLKSGEDLQISTPTENDLFASGFSIDVDKKVMDDAHLAGFNIDVNAPIGGNLYTAGGFIDFMSPIAGDLTASGFTLDVSRKASVGGNARLTGRKVILDGDIDGSASIAAETVVLNGTVAGDMSFFGRKIKFGDNARISGQFTYQAPSPINVPHSVIASDKITYKPLSLAGRNHEFEGPVDKTLGPFFPSFWGVFLSVVTTIGGIFVVSVIFLALMPNKIERLRKMGSEHMLRRGAFGFLTLSTLFGLVPVAAMTIIGGPFIPLVVLVISLGWLFGYVLGAYTIAHKVLGRYFKLGEGQWTKVFVLMAGLIVFPLLNVVPVLGWLFNLTLLFLGLGVVAQTLINRASDKSEEVRLPEGLPV